MFLKFCACRPPGYFQWNENGRYCLKVFFLGFSASTRTVTGSIAVLSGLFQKIEDGRNGNNKMKVGNKNHKENLLSAINWVKLKKEKLGLFFSATVWEDMRLEGEERRLQHYYCHSFSGVLTTFLLPRVWRQNTFLIYGVRIKIWQQIKSLCIQAAKKFNSNKEKQGKFRFIYQGNSISQGSKLPNWFDNLFLIRKDHFIRPRVEREFPQCCSPGYHYLPSSCPETDRSVKMTRQTDRFVQVARQTWDRQIDQLTRQTRDRQTDPAIQTRLGRAPVSSSQERDPIKKFHWISFPLCPC